MGLVLTTYWDDPPSITPSRHGYFGSVFPAKPTRHHHDHYMTWGTPVPNPTHLPRLLARDTSRNNRFALVYRYLVSPASNDDDIYLFGGIMSRLSWLYMKECLGNNNHGNLRVLPPTATPRNSWPSLQFINHHDMIL